MKRPKNQHWVPRFYLRQFATPESRDTKEPKAWIFSNDSGDPCVTSLRNIAAQRYLYSPSAADGSRSFVVEEKLGEVESLLSSSWPLLTDNFPDLHGDEGIRKALALFVSLLHLRHPDRLAEMQEIHADLVQALESLPKDQHGRPLVDSVEYKGFIRPFDNSGWEEYRDAGAEDHKHMFVTSLTQNATLVAQMLMRKRWSVLRAEEPVFITTDRPVALLHPTKDVFGIETPGTIISFPISPTRVLVMDDRLDQPKGHYYAVSPEDAVPSNQLAWLNSDRFMISPRPTDLVCAEMLAYADAHYGSLK